MTAWGYTYFVRRDDLIKIGHARLPQSRAAIVEIGAAELAVDPAKIDAFKGWCLSSDIEWQDPEWLLCRMYTTAGSFRPWLNSTINSPRSCL